MAHQPPQFSNMLPDKQAMSHSESFNLFSKRNLWPQKHSFFASIPANLNPYIKKVLSHYGERFHIGCQWQTKHHFEEWKFHIDDRIWDNVSTTNHPRTTTKQLPYLYKQIRENSSETARFCCLLGKNYSVLLHILHMNVKYNTESLQYTDIWHSSRSHMIFIQFWYFKHKQTWLTCS